MVLQLAVLHDSECWPRKKTQIQRLRVVEIRNEVIRGVVKVAPIENKIRETRLRWFGEVKRRSENSLLRRCETINVLECRRGIGRLKKSWNEVIKYDLKIIGLTEDMIQDKHLWRYRIKIVDHR